ncbi:MAG TPA: NDP-sugar synthase [Pyrinomonadaceae bacterium]|jgi:NDP-sugar pyrophosphorylase family protein|nr:NDP-sugar synthase [Pyrinomonadaceae bacterium]
MQAFILAGGKASSLRPLTVYTPKPVIPVCNRPFLLYQIDFLRRAGINSVTVSLSYEPDKVESKLGDAAGFGVNLNFTYEPKPIGTAGAYRLAAETSQEPFIVLNGDILTDIDLKAVIREHEARKAAATIVLAPVENPSGYGLVEAAEDGRVRAFLEKPKAEEIRVNTVNAGIYVLDPRVPEYVPAGENYSFEYDLFPDLLRRRESFYAHVPKAAYWQDIGTPARYLQAHLDILAGRVRGLKLKDRRGTFDLATQAEVDRVSVIADGCTIKPGAQVINSVLGAGVHVEEKARIENSVVWPHTRVGSSAQVVGAVVGRGCHIGRSAHVGPGAVLGDKTSLTDYTRAGGAL